MGDFNEILSQAEKYGALERRSRLIENFHIAISDCALVDFSFTGFPYTWSNKRKSNPVYARLDRFLARIS